MKGFHQFFEGPFSKVSENYGGICAVLVSDHKGESRMDKIFVLAADMASALRGEISLRDIKVKTDKNP